MSLKIIFYTEKKAKVACPAGCGHACSTKVEDEHLASFSITHNLAVMADEAGIYRCLWKPETIGLTKAGQLKKRLKDGLIKLKNDPENFKQFNPIHGGGSYAFLVSVVGAMIEECRKNPKAKVSVSRTAP